METMFVNLSTAQAWGPSLNWEGSHNVYPDEGRSLCMREDQDKKGEDRVLVKWFSCKNDPQSLSAYHDSTMTH